MHTILSAWLLSLQMLLSVPDASMPVQERSLTLTPRVQVQQERTWWGLIDPELATWFSRIPQVEREPHAPVLWDFSWRGFLAALFGQTMTEEVAMHAPRV